MNFIPELEITSRIRNTGVQERVKKTNFFAVVEIS